MAKQTVLAVDLGAESGRVVAVHFDGRALQAEELHRFSNLPTTAGGALYWDILHLWRDVQAGIEKGRPLQPASVGVDAWGVDFGLLDAHGDLIGNPVHYRDRRTEGMMEAAFVRVPRAEIFDQTGIQFMPINTLYQLLSLATRRSPQLQIAETLLTIPDLLNYWLTGTKVCEFTNATTTQMVDPRTGTWAVPMLERLGFPTRLLPEIVPPGTRLGEYAGLPVIAPACHDTGSAVAAVSAQTPRFAYISSGTWSLVGLEVDAPVINAASLAANVTNEGGVGGTFRLLKNVMGLWILQQCRSTWAAQGQAHSYDELVALARRADPLAAIIDPDDGDFLPPGDHPQKVRDFCTRTGQPVPADRGAIVRCVLESLALKYREVLDALRGLTGQPVEAIHIVGGGAQNRLLNQMTANATGAPVVAGPVEATVLGNGLVQLVALGEIGGLGQARQLVADSAALERYEPQETARWDEAYRAYRRLSSK